MQMFPLFSFIVFGAVSCSMQLLFGLTVPQQEICLFAKSSYNSGEKKKLSVYSSCLRPSVLSVLSLSHGLLSHAVPCPVYPSPSILSCHVYLSELHSLKIFMLKHLCFFGMYCLKITLPLKETMTLSLARFLEGL
jgi:hypothetical protein